VSFLKLLNYNYAYLTQNNKNGSDFSENGIYYLIGVFFKYKISDIILLK
jgi:hypothetical protein